MATSDNRGAYVTGGSKLKNRTKNNGLIQRFILFDKVATVEQRAKMDNLRYRLRLLSKNPCKDLDIKFELSKEISKLRQCTNATMTTDMLAFNDLI
jgi:hypothetical protein